jgi:hypothetical protein
MVIFGYGNASKWIHFSKSTRKTRVKMLWKKIFLDIWGSNMGQSGPIRKIDHFTNNGPKSSKLKIFHRGKAQNDEN